VLRKIYGPKNTEESEQFGTLHNEELRNIYRSPSIVRVVTSRKLLWTGYVAMVGETSNEYRILMGKPLGKCSRGTFKRGWEDNSVMHVRRIGGGWK
jgi:hypothetical protein